MIDNQILQGDLKQWRLIQLLAEGDAGEVFLVEAMITRELAILKRPRTGGFPADITRQSSQIAVEASLLKVLHNLKIEVGDFSVQVADLLDQSLPGTELTSQFFIVIEKAAGLSLSNLAKTARFGPESAALTLPDDQHYLLPLIESIEQSKQIPELVILRALKAILVLLETIHTLNAQWFDGDIFGILWNDVKPDHIYWDPAAKTITVIDWGNGQFLEQDGISRDRMYSKSDDYRQLVDEMQRFLSEAAPNLRDRLAWPDHFQPDDPDSAILPEIANNVSTLLTIKSAELMEARQREYHYLSSGVINLTKLEEIEMAQQRVLNSGELPDHSTAEKLYQRSSALLASNGNIEEFIQVCRHAVKTIPKAAESWKTLQHLGEICLSEQGKARDHYLEAIREGINDRWVEANWSLCLACLHSRDQNIWNPLNRKIRRLIPEMARDTTTPYLAAVRLLQGLEDDYSRLIGEKESGLQEKNGTAAEKAETLRSLEILLVRFKNEIVRKWTEIEPPPPGADLSYSPVEELINDIQRTLRKTGIDPLARVNSLKRALSQPQAQTAILLDTWRAKGFRTAQKSLRYLLLWDPDRFRIIRADQAIEAASTWIEDIRRGPDPNEKILDYAIRMEYTGRDLRSRVGNAPWIEVALSLFSKLRSGSRPGDLIEADPNLTADYPWLKIFARKPPQVASLHKRGSSSAQTVAQPESPPVRAGKLGPGQDLQLGDPLDTWVPEARGSSARVFTGILRYSGSRSKQAAIKIMRPDKVDYALPLFWEEVQVLSVLNGLTGISGWMECGFLRLEEHHLLPSESTAGTASALSGELIRFGTHESSIFLDELADRCEDRWLPYIALEVRKHSECLLQQCDEGYTKGQYLSVDSGVQMAVQICAVLESAHDRNIVYRDHKILHYYWEPVHKKISVIDWNVAKLHPDGLSETEKQLDLVQLGARALHHILTGRPAPGALPVGPTRPDEVEAAPQSYSTAWTYDDKQRLSSDLRDILSELLRGGYNSAAKLREDLLLQLSFTERLRGE